MAVKLFLKIVLCCTGMMLLTSAGAQLSNKPGSLTQVPPPTATATTLASTPGGYTNPQVNYVRTWEPLKKTSLSSDLTTATLYTDARQTTQYLDGLGRPLQTVQKGGSPGGFDIVAPVVYDVFGREALKYLPYAETGVSASGSFKTSPFSSQDYFYKNNYKDAQGNVMLPGEQVFYGKTIFEASPLNRVDKAFAPGNSWAGSEGTGTGEKSVQQKYLVNTATEGVRIWSIGFSVTIESNVPSPSGAVYGDGQLYKNVSIDEAGNAVVEYKDKEGKVILKKVQIGIIANADYSGHENFLCTYYVYDDLNQLRFVIPPKAVAAIASNWTLSTDVVSELCFRYEYDERGRMIGKKVPGAGWVYMVYDKRDRLVYTQDANIRGANRWLATLYDVLNRPVMTGMITYAGDRAALQTAVNGATSSSFITTNVGSGIPIDLSSSFRPTAGAPTVYRAQSSIIFNEGFETEGTPDFETEIVSGASVTETIAVSDNPGTLNQNIIPLTFTYYDSYSWTAKNYTDAFNTKLTIGNNPANQAEEPLGNTDQAKVGTLGMVTGTKVRVVEDPADLTKGVFIAAVNYYDDKGRVIQAQSDNYKGGTDIVTNRYDFTGKVLSSYAEHKNPAAVNPVTNTNVFATLTDMFYDHGGRVLEVGKTLDNITTKRVVIQKNTYDALGQLQKKELGKKRLTNTSAYNASPVTALDYNYNIRGWLQGINKAYARNATGAGSDTYFGMELNYDWGFDANQYNGNIGGTRWRSKGDGAGRAYGFSYDKANRLLSGDFNQQTGAAVWDKTAGVDFSVRMGDGTSAAAAYDENGNIKRMQQWGLKLTGSTQIDDLYYTYSLNASTNTNKLLNVKDVVNDPQTILGDFRTSALHTQAKTASTVDYTYDVNGNLKKDLNKDIGSSGADGITYNHLNLPSVITVTGKGTITYIYDAAGNKLEKRVAENTATVNKSTITSYLGGGVYENDVVQFMGHEEGRIRYKPAAAGVTAYTAFDYMIKDHLGNVRMVLTDEVQQDAYPAATMETLPAATEEVLYTNSYTFNFPFYIIH